MDLNSARIFVNVVSKGSFSAAAAHMGVPVATVSRRVAELESSLGVRLLERSTRKLRLTEAGATLFQFAARGVQEMESGLLALSEKEQNLQGRLRLSIPPNFEPIWRLLNEFHDAYQNIDIDIFVSQRRLDFIEDGIDVAIRIGEIDSQSAVARLLMTYRHRVVTSPDYLTEHPIHSPADILSGKCAAWAKHEETVEWSLGGEKIGIRPYLRANDYMYLRYLVLNHDCITELPPFFCLDEIENGKLVEILPDYPMPELPVNLVFPSRKQVSRITRVFIDYCVDNFQA